MIKLEKKILATAYMHIYMYTHEMGFVYGPAAHGIDKMQAKPIYLICTLIEHIYEMDDAIDMKICTQQAILSTHSTTYIKFDEHPLASKSIY